MTNIWEIPTFHHLTDDPGAAQIRCTLLSPTTWYADRKITFLSTGLPFTAHDIQAAVAKRAVPHQSGLFSKQCSIKKRIGGERIEIKRKDQWCTTCRAWLWHFHETCCTRRCRGRIYFPRGIVCALHTALNLTSLFGCRPVGLPFIPPSLYAFALNRFNLANVTKHRGQLFSVWRQRK